MTEFRRYLWIIECQSLLDCKSLSKRSTNTELQRVLQRQFDSFPTSVPTPTYMTEVPPSEYTNFSITTDNSYSGSRNGSYTGVSWRTHRSTVP